MKAEGAIFAMICATLLVAAPHVFAGALLPPEKGAILPPDLAAQIVNQCSRRVPGPIEGTWMPAATQVQRLDAQLQRGFPKAYASWASFAGLSPDAARRDAAEHQKTGYYRQYAGLIIHGRRIIYVNAFSEIIPSRFNLLRWLQGRHDWRTDLDQDMCDGGAGYFGAEYDAATGVLKNITFNGPG
jgi:hypothetical protein